MQLCTKYRYLPLVLKEKRSCFSQIERSAVQLLLDRPQVGGLIGIWKPSIQSRQSGSVVMGYMIHVIYVYGAFQVVLYKVSKYPSNT